MAHWRWCAHSVGWDSWREKHAQWGSIEALGECGHGCPGWSERETDPITTNAVEAK
jgi:hypothetical protein